MKKDAIRAKLLEKKMTASALAEKLGISKTHLSYIMNGKRTPSLDLLENIAEELGTDLGELMGNQPTPESFESKKIPKDLKKILEEKTVMFDGEMMNEDDKKLIEQMLTKMYYKSKELNKHK